MNAYMGVFDRLFGRKKNKPEQEEPRWSEMTPLEEFVKRFTDNGGLFLMAEKTDDIYRYLKQILNEEEKERYVLFDDAVEDVLRKAGTDYTTSHRFDKEKDIFFAPVMHLIRNRGGIMLSANQTGGIPWKKLPGTAVLLATPSQLEDDPHEAMGSINRRFRNGYPEQIVTYTHFHPGDEDFKKVYLILHYE